MDSTDNNSRKPEYRFDKSRVFQIFENRESEITDKNPIESRINEIKQQLENQLFAQAQNYNQRISTLVSHEIVELKKQESFLESYLAKTNIKYRLIGDISISPIEGNSIIELLQEYLKKAQAFMQPNELLNLQVPQLLVDLDPELLKQYQAMSSQSRSKINDTLYLDERTYTKIFLSLRQKAVFG